MRVIALATCHNRRDLTLKSIKCIRDQKMPPGCDLQICLVDDGSTDGTREAVNTVYPDVEVLKGTGKLFWAGGMCFGWESYVKNQSFDYLLAFNDDISLYPNALNTMMGTASYLENLKIESFAISGAFIHPVSGETTYGGVVKDTWWHPLKFRKISPNGKVQDCDTLNMNFVLINQKALKLTNFLSSDFVHKIADYEFGLRLKKAGGRVVLAGEYVGTCANNSEQGTANELGISFTERWTRYFSVKGQKPILRVKYYKRHAGPFWMIFLLISYLHLPVKYLKLLIRSFVIKKNKC